MRKKAKKKIEDMKIKDVKDEQLQKLLARMRVLNEQKIEVLKRDFLRKDFGDDYDEDSMLRTLANEDKIREGMLTGEITYREIFKLKSLNGKSAKEKKMFRQNE